MKTIDPCSKRRTEHDQVLFITIDGNSVYVDEGLLEILEEFRRLGVRTQFSCEGGEFSAYVLGDWRGMARLLRKFKKQSKNGYYSGFSKDIIESFHYGRHEFELANYRDARSGAEEPRYIFERSRGQRGPRRFAIEKSYSPQYGARITLRWPRLYNHRILNLLKETR